MERVANKLKPVDTHVLPSQTAQPRTLDILEELTPTAIENRLIKQAELRNTFLKFIRESMKKDIHYMPPPRKGAPAYLKQEGSLLLMHFYQCEDNYEILKEVYQNDFYAIAIKCSLRHPSGKTYVGLGWANSGGV